MKLEQQIAVITGGASGMGKATAEALHDLGIQVAILDRHEVSLEFPCYSVACDVSQDKEVEEAFNQIVSKLGVPRICINCAGIAPAQRMVSKQGVMPLENFKQVIDINLVGTFNVMRRATEKMLQLAPDNLVGEERGVIINTASIAAYEGQIGQLAYSASKGGIVAMTLPAARELAQHAIRVITIAPGLMATPLLSGMPQEVQESLAATTVFPKRLGKPQEFAALVIHIIENSYINGEVIRLDGALRMQAR